MKLSYTHVDEPFESGPPCRFCDDPSNTNGKGAIVQTGTSTDGRPLNAHPECSDDPFSFTNTFNTLSSEKDLECPNCGMVNDRPGFCSECMSSSLSITPNPVDVDFIGSNLASLRTLNATQAPGDTPLLPGPEVDAPGTTVDARGVNENNDMKPLLTNK